MSNVRLYNNVPLIIGGEVAVHEDCCCVEECDYPCEECPDNCGPPCFWLDLNYYNGSSWEYFDTKLHYCPGGIVPSTSCLRDCCWRGKYYDSGEGEWFWCHLFHDGTRWKIEWHTGTGYDLWINCVTHWSGGFAYDNDDFTCETGGTFSYDWGDGRTITCELTVCTDCDDCPP